MNRKRVCGRKKKRHEMTIKELKASRKWCLSEISKIDMELERKRNQER